MSQQFDRATEVRCSPIKPWHLFEDIIPRFGVGGSGGQTWCKHTGKYLAGYSSGEHRYSDLESAQSQCLLRSDCGGITYEPYNSRKYTLRKGTILKASPSSEISFTFNKGEHEGLRPFSEVLPGVVKTPPGAMSFFETGEHEDLYSSGPPGVLFTDTLTLPNNIILSYGEIIAFAGDFYGIPDTPICIDNGTTERARFMNSFNTLARADHDTISKEISEIRKITRKERRSVDLVRIQDFSDLTESYLTTPVSKYRYPSDVYKHHGTEISRHYDEVLGGSWVLLRYGRMMKLAANNPDHFQPHSLNVWRTGHQLAIELAQTAGRLHHDGKTREFRAKLSEAYAVSAFSCHFLTDSFAGGHIRVPRQELHVSGIMPTSTNTGDLLCHYQHDEDGKFGVNVTNNRGDRWTSYGDGTIWDKRSERNSSLVRKVVKICVDQVWEAMAQNKTPDFNEVLDLIPRVDDSRPNNTALFRCVPDQNDKMIYLRRKDVSDLQCKDMTDNWWGWSTVLRLQTYEPTNSAITCGENIIETIIETIIGE